MHGSRHNCFDALRIALAVAVLYGHSFNFGAFGPDPVTLISGSRIWFARDAVLGFFGLSGYLIAASWRRSDSLVGFLSRRVLRIVPGFWACLVVTAFLFAPAIERQHGPFPFRGAFDFVWRNAGLHLAQNLVGHVSAGSLWSIWPEFFCYLAVAAAGCCARFVKNRSLLIFLVLGLLGLNAAFVAGATLSFLPGHLAGSLVTLTPYFLSFAFGSLINAWPEKLLLNRLGIACVLAGLAAVTLLGGFDVTGPILIAWLIVSVGESFYLKVRPDISYGTYLYGYSVQQLFATIPWFSGSWLVFFVSGLAGSLAAGWLSWYFVERHFRMRESTIRGWSST
jgi:peptidoglycan/LPS O-acetylase OafA/YrhL